jgi:hypothetical protein
MGTQLDRSVGTHRCMHGDRTGQRGIGAPGELVAELERLGRLARRFGDGGGIRGRRSHRGWSGELGRRALLDRPKGLDVRAKTRLVSHLERALW